jgi:hypothetical protein
LAVQDNPAIILATRVDASPTAGDILGGWYFRGDNHLGTTKNFIQIFGISDNITSGSEISSIQFKAFQDGTNDERFRIKGKYIGINQAAPTAMLHIVPKATTDTSLFIKGIAAQTADFFTIQNSGGTELADIDSNGHFKAHISHGELYENNVTGGTNITVVTAGTYVQWVSSTAGDSSGANYVVADTAADDLTIGSNGAGDYKVDFKADCESAPGLCNQWLVHKNGSATHIYGRATTPDAALIPPTGDNVHVGTLVTGDYTNVNTVNSIYHQVQEDNATPAIDIRYYYTDTSESSDVCIFNGLYVGTTTHHEELEVLDITVVADSGTAEVGGNDTLQDTDQAWTNDEWIDYLLFLTGGTGSGQWKRITDNDGDTLTVESNWTTNPDNTTEYEIRGNWDDYGVAEDIPHAAKIDYERRIEITGTLANYYDPSSRIVWRIIHPDPGNTNHDHYTDRMVITNNKAVTSVSGTGILSNLASTDTVDLRLTCNVSGAVFTTKHINLNIFRINR